MACNFQVLCGELVQKDEDIAVEIKLAYSYPPVNAYVTLFRLVWHHLQDALTHLATLKHLVSTRVSKKSAALGR